MAIQKHTVGTEEAALVIYAETANLNYFLSVDVTADSPATSTVETVTFGAHTRRQYPGDETPVSVAGGARTYLANLGRRTGPALPGKGFRLVAFDDDGAELEDRQFTYVGTFKNLVGYLTGNVVNKTFLYNNTGGSPVVLDIDETP